LRVWPLTKNRHDSSYCVTIKTFPEFCSGEYDGKTFRVSKFACPPLVRAQGIEVESPQDLHEQIRGLGTDSPVFLPGRGQKNAPEDGRFPVHP
jgi:hypothetical protein